MRHSTNWNHHDESVTTEVLMQELSQAREDSRSTLIQVSAIIGVGLALLIVITKVAIDYHHTLPWIVYLTSPLAPVLLISYVVLLESNAVIRTYYMRALEVRLIDRIHQEDSDLSLPSWSHFDSHLNGGLNAIGPMAINWLFIYFGIFAILISWMGFMIWTQLIGWRLQVIGIVFDVSILLPPTFLAILNLRKGRAQWQRLETLVSKSLTEAKTSTSRDKSELRERSLRSFLIIPRIEDLILKSPFLPLSYILIGFLTRAHPLNATTLYPMIGVWLAFELLIYQSRYLVNDVRGRFEDSSPTAPKRRFPASIVGSPYEPLALRYCFSDLILRVTFGVALILAFAPSRHFAWIVCLLFIFGLAAVSWLYEYFRVFTDALYRRMIGSNERLDAIAESRRFASASYLVTAMVGSGYALRCLFGVWLVGSGSWKVYVLAGSFAWAYGCMFVYMTWIIESTNTEPFAFTKKVHLFRFSYKYRKIYAARSGLEIDSDIIDRNVKILSVWQSPLTALVLLAVVGQLLMSTLFTVTAFRHPELAPWMYLILVETAFTVGVLSLPMRSSKGRPPPSLVTAFIGLVASSIIIFSSSTSWQQRTSGEILLELIPVTALIFRNLSYADIENAIARLFMDIRRLVSTIPGWFLGGAR
ncbi:MAG: hypothetical protein ACHQFZ_02200 [Acidimicrobiales bacterium]